MVNASDDLVRCVQLVTAALQLWQMREDFPAPTSLTVILDEAWSEDIALIASQIKRGISDQT